MIELEESKEIIALKSDKLEIEMSKSSKELKIISLTTGFSISGIVPAINVFYCNRIVSLIPDITVDCSFIEFTLVDEVGKGKGIYVDLVFSNESFAKITSIQAQFIIKLYHHQDFCTFQLIIPEQHSAELSYSLHSLAPIRITAGTFILNESGITRPEDVTFFEHGFQSWSLSKTRAFEEAYEHIPVDVIASIQQNRDDLVTGRYVSEYVTAITDRESKGSLVLGFCTLADSYSRIVMDHLSSPSHVSWLSAYSQFDNIPINQLKMQPVRSEELFISFKPSKMGYQGLLEYAGVTGKRMNVQSDQCSRVGWCSWYYYYLDISSRDLLKNVKFFEEHSPAIPIDMIQLDDGYFTAIGDYTSFNSKFPVGLSEFVDQVHGQNKAAGIWIAPFFAAENSDLFQKNPDWFLKSKTDQKLLPVCYNWDQIEYALDLTRPDVQKYLKDLVWKIVNEWYFDFIKIDFVYAASVYESHYQEKGLTRAQVYRLGVKIIREAMGKRAYLLGCGAPIGPSIGLVDAMRVSKDTRELWDTGNDPVLSDPCLKGALAANIYRSFMHDKLWINDPDCLIVRKANSKLTEDELRLQLTVFGLTGGQLLISDDMEKLENERLALALRLIPPFPETAIPVDALYETLPTLYLLETERTLGKRALLAVINWNDEPVERNLKLKDILTEKMTSEQFFVFDWWNKELLGCYFRDEPLPVLKIQSHGCRYLGIIPRRNLELPLVLSSTLHISQGLLEIKRQEIGPQHLGLTIELPGHRKGDLFILFPEKIKVITGDIQVTGKLTNWGVLYRLSIELLNYKEVRIEFVTKTLA
ncbi:MAG: glycoside hydrolase family 36 protein [Candidatus Odinarchaeota archaeon]